MDLWTSHWSLPRADHRIYVIVSDVTDARAGLIAAGPLARELGTSVVILVPHIVPYGTEIDRCGHDLVEIGEGYRATASASPVDTEVRVCACREARHALAMLVDNATVVLPWRRGRWRRTPPERLAKALELEGHRIVFVDMDARQRPEQLQDFLRHLLGRLQAVLPIVNASAWSARRSGK